MLERTPKIKLNIPKLNYPQEETEIPIIIKIMKENKLDSKEMRDADLKPEKEMFDIGGENKKNYEDLIEDINYYAMTLKMKYQRPRPYEISNRIKLCYEKKYGRNINIVSSNGKKLDPLSVNQRHIISNEKLKKLGFQPKISIDHGINQLFEYLEGFIDV